MIFHNVYGESIALSEHNTLATRDVGSYGNGIVFSNDPIAQQQKITIQVTCTDKWKGGIRVGVTSNDPKTFGHLSLPKFAVPDLSNQDGFWLTAINDNCLKSESKISLLISATGKLHVFVDKHNIQPLEPCELPVEQPVWACFDIYGNTISAKFISADDAPLEIITRGTAAVCSYDQACVNGVQSVRRTTVMLIGQNDEHRLTVRNTLLSQINSSSVTYQGDAGRTTCVANDTELCGKSSFSSSSGYHGDTHNEAEACNLFLAHLHNYRGRVTKERASIANIKPTPKDTENGAKRGYRRTKSMPTTKKQASQLRLVPELTKDIHEPILTHLQSLINDFNTSTRVSRPSSGTVQDGCRSDRVEMTVHDITGPIEAYSACQMVLTRRSVYVVMVDLDESSNNTHQQKGKCTQDEYLDFWLHCIHLHTSHHDDTNISQLSPPVIVLATHTSNLSQLMINKEVSRLQGLVKNKPYNVQLPLHVLYLPLKDTNQVSALFKSITEISSHQRHMGEHLPVTWLQLYDTIHDMVNDGVYYIAYSQLQDICCDLHFDTPQDIDVLLQFFHDIGVIIYYGNQSHDELLCNTVILHPHWLVKTFNKLLTLHESTNLPDSLEPDMSILRSCGILSDVLISHTWSDLDQIPLLLGLLTQLHIISPTSQESGSYYMPSSIVRESNKFTTTPGGVCFYLNFHTFLPDSVFHGIVTQIIKWSGDLNETTEPQLMYHYASLTIGDGHKVVLHKPNSAHRIKITVLRTSHVPDLPDTTPADPHICARVRRRVEGCISNIESLHNLRLPYTVSVPCLCSRVCPTHQTRACLVDECVHLLDLDECLTNTVVLCHQQRVKTEPIKKLFPQVQNHAYQSPILPLDPRQLFNNLDRPSPDLPLWIRSAAKLLSTGFEQNDWTVVATELGYKAYQIDVFYDCANPSLALLSNWILSSGNTTLSIDVLVTYLERLDRDDVVDVINAGREVIKTPCQVFISYQWDIQDDVIAMRDRLERVGHSCWMDIGQLGGGDQLSTKIDAAIRSAQVVIACITPKYAISHYCSREISLADLLHKPIIPVLYGGVSWPPQGPMALLLSQLVYVNIKGVGGHGGSGIHADLDDKYNEIIQKVGQYAKPALDTPPATPTQKHVYFEDKQAHNERSSGTSVLSHDSGLHVAQHIRNVGRSREPAAILIPVHESTTASHISHMTSTEQVHISKCGVCVIL